MSLAILIIVSIIIGVSISKANARRRARQAYAARVRAWQEAQAEKARRAEEKEAHRRRMEWYREQAAALRLQKQIEDANRRARITAENRRYINNISPAWQEHTEIAAEYAATGKIDPGMKARAAALNAEKQYHAEKIRALKAG